MVEGNLTTKYAPAERANEEEVKRQIEIFKSNNVLNKFLSRIPAVFLIVNEYRQIVYMNKGALDFTGIDDITSIIGKRPGELIGCVHSNEEEGGCGTSESCTYCGAINAVLESQKGELAVRECRLIIGSEHHAFDLRVWAAPFKIDGEEYTAVTLQDIQNEKWRAFLERIFFHDILNTAGGLKGTLELLINYKEKVDAEKLMKRADKITEKLIEEIKSQQLLIIAENNLLKVSLEKFNSIEILNEMLNLYKDHDVAEGKILQIDPNSDSVEIISDQTLLKRILGNMTKNALEAIPTNSTVTLGCKLEGDTIKFWVHNQGFIPRDIQLQIFNRSFSTKGRNRGLGTYSMKFLSKFLEGEVSFTTSEEEGTTFNAKYPIKIEMPE